MSLDHSLNLRVSLTISCFSLANKDVASRSDPYAQVFMQDGSKQWKQLGRTETIRNSQNPRFTKEFVVPYHFEEEQLLVVRVWDDDYGQTADDFLGETAPFKLGTLMGSRGQTLTLGLTEKGRAVRGKVAIHAEQAEESDTGDMIHFNLVAKNLDRKDGFLFKSDPYFIISATSDGMNYVDIYKSEFIKQNLNPQWKRASVPYRRIKGKMLKLEVTDWDSDGKHDLIGIAHIKVDDLLSRRKGIELVHPPTKAKYKKDTYRNSGIVDVVDCQLEKSFTMIDYLRGGLQINMLVAIDFTGSNGDPRVPGTLHYGSGQLVNNYIQAIQAVGNIVVEYDSDKMIPAYGFGAKPNVSSQVSHCFPLSGNWHSEEVWGIEGVIQAYSSCFSRGVVLSGPTYFAEVIRKAGAMASRHPNTYSILLLITDGEVNDMQNTIDAICEVSLAPLSIIVVGVGNADFTSMNMLDADVQPLVSSHGQRCARDIVQFVPFNRIIQSGDPSLLAKETLQEFPLQLTQFYKLKGIPPAPPIVVTEQEIQTGLVAGDSGGARPVPPPPISGPGAVSVVAPPPAAEVGRIGRDLFNQAVSF